MIGNVIETEPASGNRKVAGVFPAGVLGNGDRQSPVRLHEDPRQQELVVGQQQGEQPVVMIPGHVMGTITRRKACTRPRRHHGHFFDLLRYLHEEAASIQMVKGWLTATSVMINRICVS